MALFGEVQSLFGQTLLKIETFVLLILLFITVVCWTRKIQTREYASTLHLFPESPLTYVIVPECLDEIFSCKKVLPGVQVSLRGKDDGEIGAHGHR
jgi:hypothetical protein